MATLNEFLEKALKDFKPMNEKVDREKIDPEQFESYESVKRARAIIKGLQGIIGSLKVEAYQYANGENYLEIPLRNGIIFTPRDFTRLSKIDFGHMTIESNGKLMRIQI